MTLSSIDPTIQRDRYGRPLIKPVNGGPSLAYTRATTLAGAIEDLNGLIKWKVGCAITGLVDRPDLLLAAAAHRDDKQKLYKICDDALEAGGASASATVGTALHSFTEQVDRGIPVGTVLEPYGADIAAYQAATVNLERLAIEQMLVLDEYQVAGTPDLIVRFEGENYIADKKTGSIDYPHKMAAQLAIYAHSRTYDIRTGARGPLPAVNGQRAIIIHLPAGTGTCTMHWIDIAAGWEAVQLAVQVRDWRKRKALLTPLDEFAQAIEALAPLEPAVIDRPKPDWIAEAIKNADLAPQLGELWKNNRSEWTETHTALAAARKQQLSA